MSTGNEKIDPLQHTSIYYRREDSDESDGENGMGNVNRLIVRPPGHSGKAKRGHLCFDASFETGNLGRVDLINEYEYDLYIRPDTCSPRFRFWFNFTVDNVKQDQRVIFNIVNIHIGKNLFTAKMTPMVKSSTRHKWQRMPKEYVFYHRSSTHRNHYILSFVFGFDKEDEIYQFAMAIPYSYSRLQTFLNILETRSSHLKKKFKRESLTTSLHNRRLELITIGNDKGAHSLSKKRIIAVMARINPGDSPSSMVCQGLLEILISSNSVASVLRKNVIFKILPMMNPDGVFVGNHKSNIMGVDLSRSWHIATSFSHPTLWAALQMLRTFQHDENNQLDFVIDIHAHSGLSGCFIYGNAYDDVYRYERHILFPKLFASVAVDYAKDNTTFNSDPSAIGTSRRHLCCTLDSKVNTYSLEVSIFGYKTKEYDYLIPYSEESYKRCGMNLVRAFLEYYHCIGIIPNELFKHSPTKKKRTRKRLKNYDKLPLGNIRSSAQVHVQDISITYDSEISLETCGDKNMRSPKILLKARHNRTKGHYTSRKFNETFEEANDQNHFSVEKATLSIIDINEMLDL